MQTTLKEFADTHSDRGLNLNSGTAPPSLAEPTWLLIKQRNNISEIKMLAATFEKAIPQNERKQWGQFYTPDAIAEFILENVSIGKDSTILDPTCGCGIFLVKGAEYLKKTGAKNPYANIFGIDINRNALRTTSKILQLDGAPNIENNLKHGDYIVAPDWEKEFPIALSNGGFDAIVGNPPYVTMQADQFHKARDYYSHVIDGPINCATLVLARSIRLLRDGGQAGFLLPKSLARVRSYKKLRKLLLTETSVKLIFDLGAMFKDVRGEQIILIVKKEKNKSEIKNNFIRVKTMVDRNKPLKEQPEFKIRQEKFVGTDLFPLFENNNIYETSQKLSNGHKRLDEIADIFRGIGIGANSKHISDKQLKGYEEVLRGDSIKRYGLKYKLYINSDKLKELYETKNRTLRKKKIILQNIFSREAGLIPTIDLKGAITLDTVTNVMPHDEKYLYFLLGFLDSKVANFFLISSIYFRSLLTMHTDKPYIGQLPIVVPSESEIKQIENLVKERLEMPLKPEGQNRIEKNIDSFFYRLYGLNEKDIGTIESYLSKNWNRG